jgi:lipoprotein-releasing system ATP-binding protein
MGISALGLGKTVGDPPVRILSGVNLEIARGDFVALTGRSGSGKSTLLHILGTLDRASEGNLWLDGCEVGSLARRDLDAFRNRKLGFVFQFHYLLAELSALENVLLPAHKAGTKALCRPRAEDLLRRFGLANGLHRLPRQLSGGEQQRVAIARALILEPDYLLADEPTGALDSANGKAVMEILDDCHTRLGTTIILATHDPDFAAHAPKRVHLVDGSLS